MKLFPAFIFVIIIFLAGLFFLQARRVSHSGGGTPTPSGQMRKAVLFIATIALLALFGILFTILGKVAVLLALATLAFFFLTRGRAG